MTVLTRTWIILMLLTGLSIWAGRVTGSGSLGLFGTGIVLAAANFKADQILTHFLDLRRASSGWRVLFRLILTLVGMTIFAIYVLTPVIGFESRG